MEFFLTDGRSLIPTSYCCKVPNRPAIVVVIGNWRVDEGAARRTNVVVDEQGDTGKKCDEEVASSSEVVATRILSSSTSNWAYT
ncbi:hypothetical protein Hypma_007010 [Hypsizygus marmoreus]|uniref:Uncharacterized protein n=1 Tax=Hypsizygus marmoreus TaxID=39966 RepID=A0A369KC69_HYPMA|nr:hypothetical protein Hypma_007010 [Hypsizygus marmoreus]